MREKSYDPECGNLARHFLDDPKVLPTEDEVRSLALTIQDAVEDWFFDREHHRIREEGES